MWTIFVWNYLFYTKPGNVPTNEMEYICLISLAGLFMLNKTIVTISKIWHYTIVYCVAFQFIHRGNIDDRKGFSGLIIKFKQLIVLINLKCHMFPKAMTNSFPVLISKVYFSKVYFCKVYFFQSIFYKVYFCKVHPAYASSKLCEFIMIYHICLASFIRADHCDLGF